MQNKKISKKEITKLLIGAGLYKNSEEIKKIQEIIEKGKEMNKPNDVWIISDSSCTFPSLNLKNG